MRLYFEEGTDISPKLESLMEEAAKFSLEREGIPHENAEVSVTFVDGDEIRELSLMIYMRLLMMLKVMCFQEIFFWEM